MRNLDLWLEYVDTQEIVPLFEQNAKEYSSPSVKDIKWQDEPDHIVQLVLRRNFMALLSLDKRNEYSELFSWLLARGETELLFKSFKYLLSSFGDELFVSDASHLILGDMVSFLPRCPFLAVAFSQMDWTLLPEEYRDVLDSRGEDILRALILSANEIGQLMIRPLKQVLSNTRVLSIGTCARLLELVALTVRSPPRAFDILLLGFEREAQRLLQETPSITQHFMRSLAGVAMDHVEEAADEDNRERPDLLALKRLADSEDGWPRVQVDFRLDAKGGTPETSAHIRLTAATPPANALSTRRWSVDAIVTKSTPGRAEIQCFHPLPPYVEDCSWRLQHCGPFVTSKTMFASTLALAVGKGEICGLAGLILGVEEWPTEILDGSDSPFQPRTSLNKAQNSAVKTASKYPLTCLWGPPGTGKTHTIVEMIKDLQGRHDGCRILVTAPTHNAVDNVMRRYLQDGEGWPAIRVSTEVSREPSSQLKPFLIASRSGKWPTTCESTRATPWPGKKSTSHTPR